MNENNPRKVKMWEEEVIIPTYEIGEADKNPIFSDNRVYQGSSGKVYPYPVIESITDTKIDKAYQAVWLENQYIRVMILPELGGRIQRAYDKTNGYDFVYYNQVIKPALVGLTGPWISGGIEFNWPQHHRPTTFLPVDHMLQENEDGSKTVLVNDVDQMYGTKGIASFTLYPDKAYIEIKGQLYNRTPVPQTFLWWANPAVAVNDHTQSIFPPDVHAVMDHGKRDVSKFPIATGIYYKHDYSAGVDISRYKNIPVPTSYMAEKSNFDFVGGYDYGVGAGILHIADHHVSPGKKQWTWGCGEFGKAWDRNLTDEDGPYIELMTGMFTDNQPDFTWLKPFEEKTFTQYFMPYKKVGPVKNATIDAVVNLECKDNSVHFCVYATSLQKDAKVVIMNKEIVCYEKTVTISPTDILEESFDIIVEKETDVKIIVMDAIEKVLVSYVPLSHEIPEIPQPAQPAKDPKDIMTNEELYLTGLHIEQYRHATYLPEDYYLEGLKRDSGDIRMNTAYGMLLLKRGRIAESEKYFRTALKRLTWKNPNPYNSEAYYDLGLSLFYQERFEEAYDAFFKAAWSNEQQEMSFYFLAVIAARQKKYEVALQFIEKALIKNSHNMKARGLKAALQHKLSKADIQSDKWESLCRDTITESLQIDSFDYVINFEKANLEKNPEMKHKLLNDMNTIMRNFYQNYLQAARDYAEPGFYEEAIAILGQCTVQNPMLDYYRAYYYSKLNNMEESKKYLNKAETDSPIYCFPNKLEDIAVLSFAGKCNKTGAKSFYYLGNLYYDKRQFELSKNLWETSVLLDDTYPTVLRNLALAYYNESNEPQKALQALEKAFSIDTSDVRVFLELDQLHKKMGSTVKERLAFYEAYPDTFTKRDDVYVEYITLLNYMGEYQKAYELIMRRKFHPWEGGEGKVTTQYKVSIVQLAKEALHKKEYQHAVELLEKALCYPENLGEGRLEGTKENHIYYYLGCANEALNHMEKAKKYYKIATIGTDEPAGMMYYNDQPADMIMYQGLAFVKLGKKAEANARFYRLIDYGERHIFDEMKMDYFAVSFPDFLIFKENFTKKNEAHCYYLMGLGKLGLGDTEDAKNYFEKALECDSSHQNAKLYLSETY